MTYLPYHRQFGSSSGQFCDTALLTTTGEQAQRRCLFLRLDSELLEIFVISHILSDCIPNDLGSLLSVFISPLGE